MLGRVEAILRRLPTGPVRGAEIGVFRGQMSAELLRARPDLFLYMIDSWAPEDEQPPAYRATRDSHAHVSVAMQRHYARHATRATGFAADRRRILHTTSADAAVRVTPASLDFVFLDGDHSYEGVTLDIYAWLPCVKAGGLLCGHDYAEGYEPRYDFHVVEAVDAAVTAHGWRLETDIDSTWFVRP